MPSQLNKRAELKIRDLLVANWIPANTAGYDPTVTDPDAPAFLRIHTGSYEATYADPQLTIESQTGEGGAGYSSMQGDGSGPNQRREGTPTIRCWAEAETDYNGESAEDIVHLLRLEVERIIHAHYQDDTEFYSLSVTWNGRTADNASPPRWMATLTASYEWTKTPP